MAKGSLTVVGTGIMLARQCTLEARQHMEAADVLFAAGGDPIVQHWLNSLNPNTKSLHEHYGGGRARNETYEIVVEQILEAVRGGAQAVAAFYGHPGVFVYAAHESIRRARAEAYDAIMLPGVSAEDCLYADLGIDPGRLGCQSYEATDFLVHARKFDTSAALILWQIAVLGDLTFREFEPNLKRIRFLAEVLMEDYPADHRVILYDAATLPVSKPKIQEIALAELDSAEITLNSTLYVPPLADPEADPQRLARLRAI